MIFDRLFPPFAETCRAIQRTAVTVAGVTITWTSGLRDWDEQERLWRKGRDAEGRIVDPRQVVTYARGGESWHNFGLAADFGLVRPDGTTLEWSDVADLDVDGIIDWLEVGRIAEAARLEWGGRWRKPLDMPHVQWRTVLTLAECRARWHEGGLTQVWAALREREG
jgi:peptidoglycan L-alanyl-D-glutamate endopeptidase CwlK